MSEPAPAGKFQIDTGIGPITDGILNGIINNITSGNYKDKLDKLVNPLISLIGDKLKPIVYVILVLYALILVLLIYIIFLHYCH